ncbi:MAG TPA: hypothetical protein VFE05_12750 [Longimicrobiaceae bacterium]|jgi:hypothetical protein|nr:hypothetical protein [Longimicrobiaceae bacterium]
MPPEEQRSDALEDAEIEPLHEEALEEVAKGPCSLTYCSNQG